MKRRPPPRGSRKHSSCWSSKRVTPPRESCHKWSVSEGYSPRGAGISTCDIISALQYPDFDIGDTTSMNSTSFYRMYMYQEQKSSKCLQVTSLAKFINTRNKTFLHYSRRNDSKYSQKMANIDERLGGSSYCRAPRVGRLSGYSGSPRYANKDPSKLSTLRIEYRDLRTGPAPSRSKANMQGSYGRYSPWQAPSRKVANIEYYKWTVPAPTRREALARLSMNSPSANNIRRGKHSDWRWRSYDWNSLQKIPDDEDSRSDNQKGGDRIPPQQMTVEVKITSEKQYVYELIVAH